MQKKVLVFVLLCLYHVVAFADKGLNVPNGQYILIEKQSSQNAIVDYAGFKFLTQGIRFEDPIEYEWVSMNKGEKFVEIESQNFKFGKTTGTGKFGIGFEGYQFIWEPADTVAVGKISKAIWIEDTVKACLSEYRNLWGIDIHKEVLNLEQENKCIVWE